MDLATTFWLGFVYISNKRFLFIIVYQSCISSPVIHVYNQITPVYLCISVPICPVMQIENGVASNCPTNGRCQVNSTIEYSCNPGYVSATPTTTCLNNHSWDPKPTCIAGTYIVVHFNATYLNLQQWKSSQISVKAYFTCNKYNILYM